MKKYFIYLFVAVLIFSCKTKEKEPQKTEETKQEEKQSEVEPEPNIFVVKTTFPSKDGLLISADLYEVNGKKPTILLCHQAGFSRGEYKDTALKINKMGLSCLAIDQRSGKISNGIKNDTAERAKEKGLSTTYSDAKQDIEAAIDYIYEINGNEPIMIVGSSYSASLVLLIGKDNPKVKAIAAFSPGEYIKGAKLTGNLTDFKKPIFLTSSQKEIKQIENLKIGVVEEFLLHF